MDNNYDENQDWEDHQVFVGERLKVHPTKWQDPIVLEHWGITEDFNHFLAVTGLSEFAQQPRFTYEELSREFLSTFRFEGPEVHKKSKKKVEKPLATFVVKFCMKGQRFVMRLEEFCRALRLPSGGSWDETLADTNEELVAF